jgi:RNA ligase (TIGR02306 family)
MNNEIKTTFEVRAVKLGAISKHPNADSLSITEVFGNPVILKTGSFNTGDWAVYVPVDSLVPTNRPEFAFLAKDGKSSHRVKAAKLRGIFSMGLLVPVPADVKFNEDTDFAPILGVEKWLSPIELEEAKTEATKNGRKKRAFGLKSPKLPVYGVDSFRKFSTLFNDGESVVITEKLHGSNFRAMHDGKRLWVGSHKVMRGATRHIFWEYLDRGFLWAKTKLGFKSRANIIRDAGDIWWKTAENYDLANKLKKLPNCVFYGEVYGEKVQHLTYDSPKGQKFAMFDIFSLTQNKFLDYQDFKDICASLELPTVPVLYIGPWDANVANNWKHWADNATTTLFLPGTKPHMAEGVVIKTAVERTVYNVGRVALKYVGTNYLLSKES